MRGQGVSGETKASPYDARRSPTFTAPTLLLGARRSGLPARPAAGAGTARPAMSSLTHFDAHGQAHMVDVGEKARTHRIAVASGRITMQAETLDLIRTGTSKKGDVLGIARIAAIQAAKKTSDLIPLCHPLPLTRIVIEFFFNDINTMNSGCLLCTATVETVGPTGVEMEALIAVQIGLLTIYDMCKAVDRGMVISDIQLEEKKGGSSGVYTRKNNSPRTTIPN